MIDVRVALRMVPRGFLLVTLTSSCGGSGPATAPSPVQPQPLMVPICSAGLWNHVYDPARLQVHDPCKTVTGVVANQHTSGDGDVNSQLTLDPAFADLLNDVNRSKLGGHLQVEEVCQGTITRDAFTACQGYRGAVFVPPVGAHVRVTGSYVRDANHGWMEIHPTSEIAVIP